MWLIAITALAMVFSADCMRAASEAAALFVRAVLPALFLPMVLASLPTRARPTQGQCSDSAEQKRMQHSAKKSPERASLLSLLFAFATGSPASARRIAQSARDGRITRTTAARLLVPAGVMSPMFFVGTLTTVVAAPSVAWSMLLSHWLAALLTGLLVNRALPAWTERARMRRQPAARQAKAAERGRAQAPSPQPTKPFSKHRRTQSPSPSTLREGSGEASSPHPTQDHPFAQAPSPQPTKLFSKHRRTQFPSPSTLREGSGEASLREAVPRRSPSPASPSFLSSLPAAVGAAANGLLGVCGAMMLFSVANGLIEAVARAAGIGHGTGAAAWFAALQAVMEIGGGAFALADAMRGMPTALVGASLCAACSFGGLSLWLQNVAAGDGLTRPARLLGARMLHGAIAFALCFAALTLEEALMSGTVESSACGVLRGVTLEAFDAFAASETTLTPATLTTLAALMAAATSTRFFHRGMEKENEKRSVCDKD